MSTTAPDRSADALGMLRAVIHGYFLLAVASKSFAAIGRLPATIMHPPGVMEYLSWKFYDRLITPKGMFALQGLLILSLLASAAGYLTRWTAKTSFLLVLLYQGVLRSFGHFNHDEMVGLYCLGILAASPCGDAFAVDRLGLPAAGRPAAAYRYPVLLMQMVMAWAYCSAGLLKLRLSGARFFDPDHLPVVCIQNSLDNLHDTRFRLAFWLPGLRAILPPTLALAVLWEILFPLALVWRAARPWFLAAGLSFHLGTMLLMNITFPNQVAMYAIFVDWPALGDRLRRSRVLGRWLRGGGGFERMPEEFAGVRVADADPDGMLVRGDGDGRVAGLLRRLARRPIAVRAAAEVADRLPPEVQPWAGRQSLWIDGPGRVVGGSRATIEALAASGRCGLAAILESPPLRPWTWLACRLLAGRAATGGDPRR